MYRQMASIENSIRFAKNNRIALQSNIESIVVNEPGLLTKAKKLTIAKNVFEKIVANIIDLPEQSFREVIKEFETANDLLEHGFMFQSGSIMHRGNSFNSFMNIEIHTCY